MGSSAVARRGISDKRLAQIALILWGLLFAAGTEHIVRSVNHQNECLIYAQASSDWWSGKDMYQFDFSDGAFRSNSGWIDGFLYFPQSAILYTPFELFGHPVGDVAWRLVGLSLLCHGVWRFSKLLAPDRALRIFALASFVTVGPTFNALHNGQVNLPLAATMLYATAELIQKRWLRAAVWLMLGLALKPIIMVMILLVGAVYRPMRWRLALALILFALAPFATREFRYVVTEYQQCRLKLLRSSQPDRAFSDLRGLFWALDWVMPMSTLLVLQLIAAGGTLWLCLKTFRRWNDPAASLFVLTLSACYLMLFNPRTEENSYVILAPVIALPAALLFLDPRRRTAAWILVGIAFCLTGNLWGYHATVHWLKPLACIIFIVLLVRELLKKSSMDWPAMASREMGLASAN
ncbi:MAG TPA: glycosyltransferase family 87 protein [Tepidisphaeraceae bacterium]|jgi:hypothetical protein|nr:glycosyltransferase family 87 protein [Tepidisphaeraceae bacterium]